MKTEIFSHHCHTEIMPMLSLAGWLEKHMFACPFKSNFNIECLGCGMQRSFIALLKGHVSDSIALYPGLIPMLMLFVFLLLHLKFQFRQGARILVYGFIMVNIIIIAGYILKLIH